MCRDVIIGIVKNRTLDRLGDGIHAKTVGVQASVSDVIGIGQCRIQIDHADTVARANRLDGRVELLHQRGIGRALPDALEMVEHVNFCIRITLGDLIQHDDGCLHGGGRLCISVCKDQRVVIDIRSRAQRILSVAEIVKAHLDADDVRLFPCVLSRIVVQLHAAVHVRTHRA